MTTSATNICNVPVMNNIEEIAVLFWSHFSTMFGLDLYDLLLLTVHLTDSFAIYFLDWKIL